MKKICATCRLEKGIEEFYNDKRSVDVKKTGCVSCYAIYGKNRRTKNKSKNSNLNLDAFYFGKTKVCTSCRIENLIPYSIRIANTLMDIITIVLNVLRYIDADKYMEYQRQSTKHYS